MIHNLLPKKIASLPFLSANKSDWLSRLKHYYFFPQCSCISFHLFTLLYQLCAADIIAFDDLDIISHGPFLFYCPSNRALTRSLTVTNDDPISLYCIYFCVSNALHLGAVCIAVVV